MNSLNVQSLSAKTLSVYPNPASDYLQITNQTVENFDFKLMNLIGEVVYEGSIRSAHEAKLDVSFFEPGVYFLGYISEEGVRHTKKILVK